MLSFDIDTDDSTNTENNAETRKEGVDFIEYNGVEYENFIECSDGEKVPKIDDRMESAEKYRLAVVLNYKLGPEIGNSEFTSKAYKKGSDAFPNEAIGQFEGMENHEDISLEKAFSKGHYYYREMGNGKIKSVMKDAFHAECEKLGVPKNLEVYKRNFPVAQNWITGDDMVTIEENDEKPWENIQIPQEWVNEYGGLPQVVMDESELESEPEPETTNSGAKLNVPDEFEDEYKNTTKDRDKMRILLKCNPEFAKLEKKDKVEIFTSAPFEFGQSNVYGVLKEWNEEKEESESEPEPEPEPETTENGDSDTVEIDAGELADLRMKAQKYDEIQAALNF